MNIRSKTLAIIIFTFVVLTATLVLASRIVVLGGFGELEVEHARLNVQRVVNEFLTAHSRYISTAGDWAPWDDTYVFAHDGNEAYIQKNLTDSAMANLEVNFMVFLNDTGKLVYSKWVDLTKGTESPIPPDLLNEIVTSEPLATPLEHADSVGGFLMTTSGPVFVASRAILKSDLTGPKRGHLIVGRVFDAHEVKRISELTHLTLGIFPVGDQEMPPDVSKAFPPVSKGEIVTEPVDRDIVAGYALQKDINGKSAFILKVEMPRDIYLHGEATELYYIVSLLFISLSFILLTSVLVDRIVLRPLKDLNHQVSEIGKTGNTDGRLSFSGNDEFGNLSTEINKMLQQIQDTRKKLMEEHYRTGMGEMATGILHNVRNSLNPVTVNLDTILINVAQFPFDQLEMARKELAEGTDSEERKDRLAKFVELTNLGLVELVEKVRIRLAETSAGIGRIENVLNDHQNWTMAEQTEEKIPIDDLVHDAVKVIRKRAGDVAIHISPDLPGVGAIFGHRVLLSQVVENILFNAWESLNTNDGPGEIHIVAEVERQDGRKMVRLSIRDNGIGIPRENLKRIFTYGFSSKEGGQTGIGLHWCANTLHTMNGRIRAESDGPGKGACFHLTLPSPGEAVRETKEAGDGA